MPGKKQINLTPLELEIMQVLWESGPATVQKVQQQLKRELAYTTVQTMMTVLFQKRRVKRTLKDKAYVYRPTVSRSDATGHALSDLIDRMFGGSAENLVMSLVEKRHLTPDRLAKLHQLLDKEGKDDKAD
jgi:BlaI family transcriptional regulator, penicillinase repressor